MAQPSFPLRALGKLLGPLGSRIAPIPKQAPPALPSTCFSALAPAPAVDLDALSAIGATIPGMIAPRSGEHLFSLCYFQQEQGDVVEIGSWQGRSTSFLARAVAESGNGGFFAIDHFRGNVGKEASYVVGHEDLSDLKGNFLANMERAGVAEAVNLLDMPNDQAAARLADRQVRFLFIDGDHTPEGVRRDVELFFPMLVDGAIVAFDDYTPRFPGVIEEANRLLREGSFSRVMTYRQTLAMKRTRSAAQR
jgi:predicted O-methyltransferase YrrM